MRRNRTGPATTPASGEGPGSSVVMACVGHEREQAAERAATRRRPRGRVAHRRPGSVDARRCLLRGDVAVLRADRPRRGGSARDDPGRLRHRPCYGHASRRHPLRPAMGGCVLRPLSPFRRRRHGRHVLASLARPPMSLLRVPAVASACRRPMRVRNRPAGCPKSGWSTPSCRCTAGEVKPILRPGSRRPGARARSRNRICTS
jgi:hypothetical protein